MNTLDVMRATDTARLDDAKSRLILAASLAAKEFRRIADLLEHATAHGDFEALAEIRTSSAPSVASIKSAARSIVKAEK